MNTPNAILTRLESTDEGTFGQFVAGRLGLFSGELPDRGNAPSISRIDPPGVYTAGFTWSPRFARCLYLIGPVPGRSGIRMHPANLMGDASKGFRSQLNGCIALGERLGWMDRQKCLLLSAPAVRRVEAYFGGRPFTLEIRE